MRQADATAGSRRLTLGPRGRTAIAIASAFVVFNAVFDVRMLLAERQVVTAADAAAASGTFLHIQDSLGAAAREGLVLALAASAAALFIGLRFARSRSQGRWGRWAW